VFSKNSNHKIPKNQYFNYSYGRYISNGVLVICFVGALLGIKLIDLAINFSFYLLIPGLLLIIIPIFLSIPIELLQINVENNTYRNGIKIFSRVWGEWKRLGDVKYLSLIKINKSIVLSDQNARYSNGDLIQECRLRLFIKPGEYVIIDDYEKKSSAIYIAKVLSQYLQVNILDATISPAIFMDKD
jgi:hypothetical protein